MNGKIKLLWANYTAHCMVYTGTGKFGHWVARWVFLSLQGCVTSRTGLSFIALLSNTLK